MTEVRGRDLATVMDMDITNTEAAATDITDEIQQEALKDSVLLYLQHLQAYSRL